jgi:CrcB protein
MLNLIYIFVGGGIGCLTRYGVSKALLNTGDANFPWATLIANVLSVVVMGVGLGLFSAKLQSESLRLLIITGFCGGFSTFSTFSLETLELFRRGNYMFAAGNIALSVILCIAVLAVLIKK